MLLYADSQFASPYAMSVFVALKVKGIDFELRTLDLSAGQNTGADYVAASLTARVPTLVDGDFSLSESSAICEYLQDRFGGAPLYPQDAQARARVRQVQAWLRSDLMALRSERSTEVVFYRPTPTPLSDAGQAAARKLFSVAGAFIRSEDDHIAGPWSIADVDLALMLNRLVLNGDAV
ncbi:glutathione transferase, partial [Delftia sp. SD083]